MSLGNTQMLVNLDKNTKRGTKKKKKSLRDYNGKIEQNIFACCFVDKCQVFPQTAISFEMQVVKVILFPS